MSKSEPQRLSLSTALSQNKDWASQVASSDSSFFTTLSKGQTPGILWIGCSDSRAPETTLCGAQPGQIFVHRNIANILHPGDLSAASVIEYAVAHLGVQQVVVCGHTSCGGVSAALGNARIGVIDAWLLPLRRLRAQFAGELQHLDGPARVLKLVEENVRAGVRIVRENANVIEAAHARGLTVHGLVYDLSKGELRELSVNEDKAEEKARMEAFTVQAAGGH